MVAVRKERKGKEKREVGIEYGEERVRRRGGGVKREGKMNEVW